MVAQEHFLKIMGYGIFIHMAKQPCSSSLLFFYKSYFITYYTSLLDETQNQFILIQKKKPHIEMFIEFALTL